MRRIMSICLMLMCQLALMGQARIGADPDYNPNNPGDPQVPVTKYTLATAVIPQHSGSTNYSSVQQYAEGASVYLRAYANTGYRFVSWMQEDSVVSSSSSFYYTMPAKNVTLTAVFRYNPESPSDPDSLGIYYTLTVEAQPKQGGSFNVSQTEVMEGHTTRLYAYTNTGYRFKGWKMGDSILSTSSPYTYKMGNKDAHIIGMFEYNPGNPENPGKNSWNKATGEVIVDDFTPGSLSNAIYYALNRDNSSSDEVTMITVAGKMNSNDFGIANNYYNCTLLDLSRTYGYTEIPSYAYDYNSSLQHIILPASVENIGYRAFDQCSNLSELTCYAITPPVVGSNAFRGIAEGAVLHVLSAAIPLYTEAEGWKDFTILPLTEEVRTLEVNLPEGSEDGRYKNMTLELVNAESGHKQKYVISDRISYTFSGLLKKSLFNVYVRNSLGFVLGQIDNIAIEDEDVSVTFESLLQPQDVTLSVLTAEGENVTGQVQATWFDAASNTYLSRGNTIKGVTEETQLTLRVALPQTLGMAYVAPTDTLYTVLGSNNNVNITLNALPQVTITGTVKDVTTGNAISNAVVSVSQTLNGKYSKAFTAKTDNKGVYSLTVYNVPSTLTFSSTDYISQNVSFEDFTAATELGTVSLKSITGATITTSFTYRTSVEEGETPDIQDWYSDYANVAYSIYNKTQQKAIHDFSVQYPSIVLLEEVAEGDELLLTATSKNGAFVAVEATAVIDESNRAEAIFDIVALGGIKASFTSTDNSAVVGILYDAKGQLMKKYNYSSASITINDLQDGNYTLVSMGSSTLFNSIYNLSQLPSTGLKEGSDYVVNTVAVESGLIATISNDLIPTLDESKLYYTGDNTMFSVNKTSVTAGNYLTLKGKIDFKNVYASKVSNVSMVVDLPESAEFVENSVMVGTNISSYTLDGNRLTIPLERYTDQVRFCIIPTAGGDYAPNAFAQFTIDNKEVLQPIGSAHYTIKDLSISVPSTVAKTTIPVSGTALGNSTIQIYDNGVLIGETTSLANGVWSTTCELDEPYNLSKHKIYAKVTTKEGLELISETKDVEYNISAIEPKTVTMSFYNGWLRKNIEVVFDLQNKTNVNSSYMFYTTTDITFVADLTNNDTTVVQSVTIRVYTDRNNWYNLAASYDRNINRWVAVRKFSSSELPVGVMVDFVANKDFKADREQLASDLRISYEAYISSREEREELEKEIEVILPNQSVYDSIFSIITADSLDAQRLHEQLFKLVEPGDTIEYDIDALCASVDELVDSVNILSKEADETFSSFLDDWYAQKDSSANTNDDIESSIEAILGQKTISKTKLSSIDVVELEKDGYDKIGLTDSSFVFVKVDSVSRSIIDSETLTKYEVRLINDTDSITYANDRRISSNLKGCIDGFKMAVIQLQKTIEANGESADQGQVRHYIAILSSVIKDLGNLLQCVYENSFVAISRTLDEKADLLATPLKNSEKKLLKKAAEVENALKSEASINSSLNNLINYHIDEIDGLKIKFALATTREEKRLIEEQIANHQKLKNSYVEQLTESGKRCGKLTEKYHQLQTKLVENAEKLTKRLEVVEKSRALLRKVPVRLTDAQMLKGFKIAGTAGKVVGTSVGALLQMIPLWIDCYDFSESLIKWGNLWDKIFQKLPCDENKNEMKWYLADAISSTYSSVGAGAQTIQAEAAALVLDVTNVPHAWLASLALDIYSWVLGYANNKFTDWSRERLDDKLDEIKCNSDTCSVCGKEPCECKDKCTVCGKDPCVCDPQPRKEPIHDPSGYVYEGVSSNRVEGVMASCYYKKTVEDMYGDLHENVVLWDAEQYAQENPLFTDENGMYRWDVPQGLWQVKFEKEGYETTYSDWLPVPPPQLEVNVAIKQNTQPEVKVARAYEDAIEVEFSKYMQPDLLNTDNIVVTKNGEATTGEVKLLNEEEAYEGKAEKYASKLRFIPEVPFLTTDEVVLTVSRKVKSYAGIPMEADYTQEFDIEKEVKSLVADSLVTVPYGGTKQMTISALPYDAAIGKRLVVKSSSSMIATVDADTLMMDENGQATVTLTGELPGTSVVTFALADADVNGMSTIQVAIVEEKVTANPTASRVSGTAVYRGTEVALSCDTEDAVIYYTLDGSCPCDEATRIEYKEPIVITEDSVVIKAIAVADGMYESDVVEFHYTLKKTTLGMSLKEGWNWVSHNVEAPVAASELQKNATRIVSQTEELVNDPAYGLIGNLDSISPTEAYKVQVSENTEYTLTGYEYNAATPIAVSAGWNWLGYPVNQVMSVDEAFAKATPTEGDYIVGQDGFALYNDGVWTGTLLTLNPGEGYLYQAKTAYEFAYNTSIVSKAKALYGKGVANETPWTADKHKYPNVMCVVADLYVTGKITDELSVGAFCGTECRGVGKYIGGKLMMIIYGHGGEKITFVAMNNATEEVFSIAEEVVFAETLLGSLKQAYPLHVGEATGLLNSSAEWSVELKGNNLYLLLNGKTFDRVTLTDVYGNVVLVAENVAQNEAINLATLLDGVYIVTATQDGLTYYKKIMKVGK